MLSAELVEQVLASIPRRRIGLIGDLFLDRYLDIDARLTEPSIETGLDAYQITGVRSNPGALWTIMNNLVALGVGEIRPVALIGDDGEGYELRQALEKMPGVSREGVVNCPGARTPTYTKPMLQRPGQVAEELNRLDIKNRRPTPRMIEDQLIDLFESWWDRVDAWIVLDQVSEEDCGVITRRVRDHIASRAGAHPDRFVLADSRERIAEFRGVSVKPNAREAGAYPGGPGQFAIELGRPLFLTRGEQGIDLHTPDGMEHSVPGYPVSGPIDIVGAGDSTSAGITCAMTSGLSPVQAAAFGNLVASITVQQLGTTGTATPAQVRARFSEVSGV